MGEQLPARIYGDYYGDTKVKLDTVDKIKFWRECYLIFLAASPSNIEGAAIAADHAVKAAYRHGAV